MTERRKYTGKERRGNGGKVFKTAEEIRKRKEEVADKLREYEADQNVDTKSFIANSAAMTFVIIGVIGVYIVNSTFIWIGIAGTATTLVLGERWIRSARAKARERFKKENMHLARYLPS